MMNLISIGDFLLFTGVLTNCVDELDFFANDDISLYGVLTDFGLVFLSSVKPDFCNGKFDLFFYGTSTVMTGSFLNFCRLRVWHYVAIFTAFCQL